MTEAVVTDKAIKGVLKTDDLRTDRPRQFITVPLWNQELAEKLASQGVRYIVRHENNWLSNFLFNWVLPFGMLFLLWDWMARRMGTMGKGFRNIGNRVRAHSDQRPKVTFDDVAGYEDVKQELRETVEFLKGPARVQEMFDQALLRAGCFDRRVLVDKPDFMARQGILQLYADKMRLALDVCLAVVAKRTPGFVGADLENICLDWWSRGGSNP